MHMVAGTLLRTLISGTVAAIGAASALPGMAAASQIASGPVPIPAIAGHLVGHFSGSAVPTTAQGEAAFAIPCFSGTQLADHYGLPALWSEGLTGKSKTIVIVDSYGSPTIQKDLQTFDKMLGLPNPALSIIQPAGAVPPFNPNNSTMVGWAEETGAG